MKTLVAGAGGLIGQHLIMRLRWESHAMRATVRRPEAWPRVLFDSERTARELGRCLAVAFELPFRR